MGLKCYLRLLYGTTSHALDVYISGKTPVQLQKSACRQLAIFSRLRLIYDYICSRHLQQCRSYVDMAMAISHKLQSVVGRWYCLVVHHIVPTLVKIAPRLG